jgi:hypothetical protein
MIKLICGKDLKRLRIERGEGFNITAFLDHLARCEKCRKAGEKLIEALNRVIGTKQVG